MLAVDISNFTKPFSAQALKDAGVTKAIVQLVNPNILDHRVQIPALLAAGIEVEAYVYLWFSEGDDFIRDRLEWALSELAYYPSVKMVWLDCEQSGSDNPGYEGRGNTALMISNAVDKVRYDGLEAGIYSGSWWLDAFLNGQIGQFKHLPLWLTGYDGKQDLSEYRGWKATMKQYAGNTSLNGVSGLDLDYYEETKGNRVTVTKLVDFGVMAAVLKRAEDGLPAAESMQGGNFIGLISPGEPIIDSSTGQPIDIPSGKTLVLMVV